MIKPSSAVWPGLKASQELFTKAFPSMRLILTLFVSGHVYLQFKYYTEISQTKWRYVLLGVIWQKIQYMQGKSTIELKRPHLLSLVMLPKTLNNQIPMNRLCMLILLGKQGPLLDNFGLIIPRIIPWLTSSVNSLAIKPAHIFDSCNAASTKFYQVSWGGYALNNYGLDSLGSIF